MHRCTLGDKRAWWAWRRYRCTSHWNHSHKTEVDLKSSVTFVDIPNEWLWVTEIRRFRQMLSVPKRGTARLEFLSSTDRPAPRDATGPKSFVENVVRLRQAQKPEAGPVVKLTRHVNSTHFTSFHYVSLSRTLRNWVWCPWHTKYNGMSLLVWSLKCSCEKVCNKFSARNSSWSCSSWFDCLIEILDFFDVATICNISLPFHS